MEADFESPSLEPEQTPAAPWEPTSLADMLAADDRDFEQTRKRRQLLSNAWLAAIQAKKGSQS